MHRLEAGIRNAIAQNKKCLSDDFVMLAAHPAVNLAFNRTMQIAPHSMFSAPQATLLEQGVNRLKNKLEKQLKNKLIKPNTVKHIAAGV